MARKRMIGEIVFCDDDFIGLKAEAKLLYTYLVLSADDYGLTNGIKKIFLIGNILTRGNFHTSKLIKIIFKFCKIIS